MVPWCEHTSPPLSHGPSDCSNLDIIGQPEMCETCAQANKWKWQSPTPKTPECEPVSLFRPSMDNIHNTWLRYYGKVVPYRLLVVCIFLFLFSATSSAQRLLLPRLQNQSTIADFNLFIKFVAAADDTNRSRCANRLPCPGNPYRGNQPFAVFLLPP